MPSRSLRPVAFAILAAVPLLAPDRALAWGSVGHHYIAQNYSQHLPSVIDGLKAWDSVVDAHVTDADTRKSTTPGESYRHFIDIDWYPEFATGTLSRDRATLEAEYGATTVLDNGIVPWAVPEVVTTLTQQFQAQQWDAAALTIADLCHYVGDANQPFHCTKNYDGQLTGNSGIHARYESSMISTYVGQLHTSPMPVTYYASPQDAMFNLVGISITGVPTILAADNTAKAASGGSYNATYYASLWNSTKTLTQARLDTASVMTASFVYTAWVNAGQPVVPGSTADVPPGSVAPPRLALAAGPSPFRDAVTVRWSGGGPATVDVYDLRGARVTRLADRVPGEGAVTWRPGTSGVDPGLYFVRLSVAGTSVTRRVVLVR